MKQIPTISTDQLENCNYVRFFFLHIFQYIRRYHNTIFINIKEASLKKKKTINYYNSVIFQGNTTLNLFILILRL